MSLLLCLPWCGEPQCRLLTVRDSCKARATRLGVTECATVDSREAVRLLNGLQSVADWLPRCVCEAGYYLA